MNTTKVRILAMEVISESDLPKQEKLELLDFVKETKDPRILEGVLDSYGLLENYEENDDEEDENAEEASESAMGPLKTPRDEDREDIKEKFDIPGILEKKGMRPAVASFFKREVIPMRKRIEDKLPQYTTHIPVKTPTGQVVNIKRNTYLP